jgi:hypothetical protein
LQASKIISPLKLAEKGKERRQNDRFATSFSVNLLAAAI